MSTAPQPGLSSKVGIRPDLDRAGGSWPYRLSGGSLRAEDGPYIRRVLIAVCLVGFTYLLCSIGRVLLLVFGAILLAVLFNGLAAVIARRTPVPSRWSLLVGLATLAVLFCGFFALFGAQIGEQVRQVLDQLPTATDAIGERFGIPNATQRVEDAVAAGANTNVLSRVAGIGVTILGILGDFVLVIVAGIYLASAPKLYRGGAAKLLPPAQHENVYEAFDAVAVALRLWSGGQLVAMFLVGIAAGIAFYLIGLPLPLALGVIAGVTNFIPFLGPILGSIPALIFAATISSAALIWTVVAVVAIQQVEGNVITPLIQRQAVDLPPALALFAIVVFGVLFGFLGVLLAVPLAVALMVLIKKLWIRESLGEETTLPGEIKETAESAPDQH